MYQEEVVLCGASAYNKKFYLSEDFEGLPQGIQDELKILCTLHGGCGRNLRAGV